MSRCNRIGGSVSIIALLGTPALALDDEIGSMIATVDTARVQSTVSRLEGFVTRHSCSVGIGPEQGVDAARDWIADQFSRIGGLQVVLDPFRHSSCPGAATFNVVAWIPGTTSPDRLIIIGGHYDSRGINIGDPMAIAPGANDSGSQTALVLEAARAMSGHVFATTVVFVAFSGEEEGLIGSASLANGFRAYFPNGQIETMLNADIVGGDSSVNGDVELHQFRLFSPGIPRELSGHPDGTTDNTSPSRGVMRFIGYWGSQYVPEMTMLPRLREDRPGRGGDHESFIGQGYPGVRFIEPIENLDHQHSPGDISAYVTPAYTARVAQVVVAVAASLARAPSAPQSFQASGDSTNTVELSWSAPLSGIVDHYAVSARSIDENFYRLRYSIPADTTTVSVSAALLGLNPGDAFFVSVAAVDAQGHESLFAYPEYRCDASSCVRPP